MTRRKLPLYCGWNPDRHGNHRVRFRRKGFSCYIYEKPGSAAFQKAYEKALSGNNKEGAGATKPGTIARLIARYYQSPEFQGLAKTSKPGHRGILERFKKEHGNKRVSHLKREHLKDIIGEMSDRPNAANNLLKRLSFVLDMAVDMEWIPTNPAKGIKKYKVKSDGHHTWTEEQIAAYEARHPSGSRARLAFALLLYTASRKSDAIHLGRQHMKNGRLLFTQQKTGEKMDIEISEYLLREINAIGHAHLTFLVTEQGKPFSPNGFGNWFRDRCDDAGLAKCTAHGLRKAAAVRVIEAGGTVHQAAALLGHRTLSETAKYADKANRADLADVGVNALSRGKK